MKDLDTKNDNGGAFINFYKLPNKEIYWSGSVGYSTKEIAQYNNSGECYRIATLNIKDVINQQAEINRLREDAIKAANNALDIFNENTKLRQLLKECLIALETYAAEDETCGLEEENKLAKNILPKIREVLGNEIQATQVDDTKIQEVLE